MSTQKDQFTKLYRPKTFDDVVSQQETVQILKNSVANNNVLKFILLKGTRGSGKCFSQDEYVLTASGYRKASKLKPVGVEVGYVPYNIQLFNMNGLLETTSHYYSNGVKDCLKIRTKRGFELTITPNHPLMVLNDKGEGHWVKGEDLKVGTKLAFSINQSAASIYNQGRLQVYRMSEYARLLSFAFIEGTLNLKKVYGLYKEDIHCSFDTLIKTVESEDAQEALEYIAVMPYQFQVAFISALFSFLYDNCSTIKFDTTSAEYSKLLQLVLAFLEIVVFRQGNTITFELSNGSKSVETLILKSEVLSKTFSRFNRFHEKNIQYSIFNDDPERTHFSGHDVIAEEIVSIEQAPDVFTLDFTMPDTHSFILGSCISHNTTMARIYAAAINCEHPVNGNPCCECKSCKEVFSGNSSDIIEVDAASNRGIQEMKELIKQLNYFTSSLKYRVVILDEVHSLTNEAWQALLKTLEEPRDNAVFVMCTTDPEKIPTPILSRAIALNVGKIRTAELADHLKRICEKEGIEYDQIGINVIAKRAKGIARDSVKDLDTVYRVFGKIDGQQVQSIFSVVETKAMLDFISICYHEDIQVILNETRSMGNLFPNEEKFMQNLYSLVLDCLKLKLGVDISQSYSKDDISEMQGIINSIPSKFLYLFLNKIKDQLEHIDPNLPTLDYLAISLKKENFEQAVGVVEEKQEQKPSFDLSNAIDDI